jgi:hypothetical protein
MREKPCDHPEIEPARYVGARSRWQCKSCGAPILDLDCSHPPEIRQGLRVDQGPTFGPHGVLPATQVLVHPAESSSLTTVAQSRKQQ